MGIFENNIPPHMFLFCPALSSASCLIRQQVLPFTVFRTRVPFEDTYTLFPWFRFTHKIETGPTIWLLRACLHLQGLFTLCLCRTFWYICLSKHTSFVVYFKSLGEIQNCPVYIVAEAYVCHCCTAQSASKKNFRDCYFCPCSGWHALTSAAPVVSVWGDPRARKDEFFQGPSLVRRLFSMCAVSWCSAVISSLLLEPRTNSYLSIH